MKQFIVCTLVVLALAFAPALSKKVLSVDSEITHATAEQAKALFSEFVAVHAKNYASAEEEAHRFNVFSDNLQYIAQHNREAAKGKHTYTLGLNPLADLTFEEYKAQYLNSLVNDTVRDDDDDDDDESVNDDDDDPIVREEMEITLDEVSAPASIDWRALGHVGPVRNQGRCGSCWAFSTVSMIEGAWRQAGRPLLDLSEQQLVDCVNGGRYTCATGGNMNVAAQDVISRGGVQAESTYPYCACSGRGCRFNRAAIVARIRAQARVPSSELGLLNAAASRSSVSVGVDAGSRNFQLYRSGIFSGPCGTSINHAVNIIGYNAAAWYVRNSWGSGWGSAGYIYMARNRNLCGINNWATVVYA